MNNTRDLYFASFLYKIKKYELANFEKIRINDYKIIGNYVFNIDNETWKKERLEFIGSDISKCKQGIEELKDLLY